MIINDGSKPIWKALRRAEWRESFASELQNEFGQKMTYVAEGTQIVHLAPNGGISPGGVPTRMACVMFEIDYRVKGKPVYLLGSVGTYGKGMVVHFGWQWPHVCKFAVEDLEPLAFDAYRRIVKVAYRGDVAAVDKDVAKFLVRCANELPKSTR